jgi:hypothetical protein
VLIYRQFELDYPVEFNFAYSIIEKIVTPIYLFKPFGKSSIDLKLRNILLSFAFKKWGICGSGIVAKKFDCCLLLISEFFIFFIERNDLHLSYHHHHHHYTVLPPSMTRVCPVMKEVSSEHNQKMAATISSG